MAPDQNKLVEVREKPRLARPSTQIFPSL